MSAGKGSRPRPLSVSIDEFGRNWDAAFRAPRSMLLTRAEWPSTYRFTPEDWERQAKREAEISKLIKRRWKQK